MVLGVVIIASTLACPSSTPSCIDMVAGLLVRTIGYVVYVIIGKKREIACWRRERAALWTLSKRPFLRASPRRSRSRCGCASASGEAFRAGDHYDFSEGRKYLGLIAPAAPCSSASTARAAAPSWSTWKRRRVGEMLMFENVAATASPSSPRPCRTWFMQDEHMTRRCERACAPPQPPGGEMFHIMTEKAAALSGQVEVLSRPQHPGKAAVLFWPAGGPAAATELPAALLPQRPGGLYLRRPQCHDAGLKK